MIHIDYLIVVYTGKRETKKRCSSRCGVTASVTQSSRPTGIMKSKTSENFIASESNGVKRDQELKQKQLKRGKEFFSSRVNCCSRQSRMEIVPDNILRKKMKCLQ